MAKKTKNICKPKREKTTGAIFRNQIGDLSFQSGSVAMRAPSATVRNLAPDYIVSEVAPGPKSITTTEKCMATYEKGANKGKNVKYRPCDIALQLVGPSAARVAGVPEGAYLRVCTKWGSSPQMIPVKDHEDAQRKAKRICGCVSKGESSAKCAQKSGKATRPTFKRTAAKKAADDCLKWSKNGQRCLRRAK